MTHHSPGQTIATLTSAAALQKEATQQHIVFAWGEVLFTGVERLWGQLETTESLAYEDKLAAQVHVLEDATASLGLLCQNLRRTSRRLKRHLQALRA
jgi:hypothetical protein